MEDVHESYGAIYQVVREANVAGYISPGFRGDVYRAIDALKIFNAPPDHVNIAERISLTLHALEWAALRRDDNRRAAVWNAMRALEEQWLGAPVPRS